MKTPPFACLLLAAVFGVMTARPLLGEPGTKAPAPKPKLAPRPIPGMSGPAPAESSVPAAAASAAPKPRMTRAVPGASAAQASSDPSAPARILMVFRNGAPGVPPVASAAPVRDDSAATPALVRPVSLTEPRNGQIRIISKAEAEALVSQPNP